MKDVARMLNEMKAAGVIRDYALFGAVAQMRYTEPVATLDADVLITLPDASALDPLREIYRYAASRGLKAHSEAILVGKWPVQFIPAFNDLTTEALENADSDTIEGEPVRVVTAVYLSVIALSVGRSKDHLRILSLLEADAVAREDIAALAGRHGLSSRWDQFTRRYLDG